MKKRAVLIGINYFDQEGELKGCIQDIRNVFIMLLSKGFTEFTVLHDGKQEHFPEYNIDDVKTPTAENIRFALKKIISNSEDGDMVYWHYSGHGSTLDDTNGDERDGKDETICPVDFDFEKKDSGFIRDDELRWILCEHDKDVKLRVVLDCCHSGSGMDLPFMWRYYSSIIRKDYATEEGAKLDKDVKFISGCQDYQTSADSQDDNGMPSGALTWAFLKTLKEIDTANAKSKKQVNYSWREFTEMLRYKLRKGGYEQIPQLCVCKKADVENIIDIV